MEAEDRALIEYVSTKTGMTITEAKEALCINDNEIDMVLQPGGKSQENFVQHDLRPQMVDLRGISASLAIPESELSTWAEDNMVFILYGPNISEGIVGEGPTPRLATAAFYRRWYEQCVRSDQKP